MRCLCLARKDSEKSSLQVPTLHNGPYKQKLPLTAVAELNGQTKLHGKKEKIRHRGNEFPSPFFSGQGVVTAKVLCTQKMDGMAAPVWALAFSMIYFDAESVLVALSSFTSITSFRVSFGNIGTLASSTDLGLTSRLPLMPLTVFF